MTHKDVISFACPVCRKKLKPAPLGRRGCKGRCPSCNSILIIDEIPQVVEAGSSVRVKGKRAPSAASRGEGFDSEAPGPASSSKPGPDPDATWLVFSPPRDDLDAAAARPSSSVQGDLNMQAGAFPVACHGVSKQHKKRAASSHKEDSPRLTEGSFNSKTGRSAATSKSGLDPDATWKMVSAPRDDVDAGVD